MRQPCSLKDLSSVGFLNTCLVCDTFSFDTRLTPLPPAIKMAVLYCSHERWSMCSMGGPNGPLTFPRSCSPLTCTAQCMRQGQGQAHPTLGAFWGEEAKSMPTTGATRLGKDSS